MYQIPVNYISNNKYKFFKILIYVFKYTYVFTVRTFQLDFKLKERFPSVLTLLFYTFIWLNLTIVVFNIFNHTIDS